MSYRVTVTGTAEKALKHLGKDEQKRVARMLKKLIEDSRPPGVRKLSGGRNDWRVRVGDYRILYEIDDEEKLITVWRIAHRKEAYR